MEPGDLKAIEGWRNGEDFMPTVGFLREIYVPNHDISELSGVKRAAEWVLMNPVEFSKAGIAGYDFDNLPKEVYAYHNTLGFLIEFSDILSSYPKEDLDVQVAFVVGTKDWKNDIRLSTLKLYERLKYGPYEMGKRHDPKSTSTSRTMSILSEFFLSGGRERRVEASDLLVWQMMVNYWTALNRRLKR
ncbi:hypothetical protein IID21_01265 [Patescibacteria group bacterium]|nr:hypothetical protein [Patescibacteria group bacterium]